MKKTGTQLVKEDDECCPGENTGDVLAINQNSIVKQNERNYRKSILIVAAPNS